MGRRNLNPNQIAYLRGKRFESEKKIIGGDKKSAEYKKSIAQNGPLNGDTAQRIADEYGIGRNTVKRAEKFSKVVDILPEETKHNVLSGKENITRSDKLVVWNDTLIDGHNRYRIATEHGLTYETVQKEFESREHALNWIISNQLGRRNLNPNQIAYLRGKRYETEKVIAKFKGNQHTNFGEGPNAPHLDRTSRDIADECRKTNSPKWAFCFKSIYQRGMLPK